MPIRPENRGRYPAEWKAIRERILERADNRCEGSPRYPGCRVGNGEPHPVTGSRVVLTIAHLDHTPENCADDNLRAWCQRCHNTYDAPHRRHSRACAASPEAEGASASAPHEPLYFSLPTQDDTRFDPRIP
jgi:hypothetical protein